MTVLVLKNVVSFVSLRSYMARFQTAYLFLLNSIHNSKYTSNLETVITLDPLSNKCTREIYKLNYFSPEVYSDNHYV